YAKHRNATWYVGTLAGNVAVGLGCYRFEFRVRDQVVPGFAFGEVHTRAEYRGKGYAPKLLDWVEKHQESQGRTLGMLYSDIGNDYYRRLGYEVCASNEGWTSLKGSAKPVASIRLVPFEREAEAGYMAETYAKHHAARAIAVERSADYWKYLLSRNPKDEFFLVEAGGARRGYVRIAVGVKKLLIRDLALADDETSLRRDVLKAIIALGHDRGVEEVGGWMADTPLHRELFRITPRKTELTMLKSLRPDLLLTADIIRDVDHFQEIDHV
ncbi:MAG: GNAT family N-acetyltransferase, partial [Planctomycetaceae bacterium]